MFTCTFCKEEFDYPDFKCKKQPGNHTVEKKTYVHGGSANIQNIRDRRKYSPFVILKADTEAIGLNGERVHTAPLVAQFTDARMTTADPEIQWWMENSAAKKFPISWGEQGEEVWKQNQLTPAQQVEVQRAELADVQRKIKESNELLAQTRRQKSA